MNNRANGIFAQLGSEKWLEALERIPKAQLKMRPKEPSIFRPVSSFQSLFGDEENDDENVELLQDVIVSFRESLSDANLFSANLYNANLWVANP